MQDAVRYFYLASSGTIGGSGTIDAPFCSPARDGDVVGSFILILMAIKFIPHLGVHLDTDNHTLGFSLNGIFQGVAFSNLPAATTFYPAICLYYRVKFLF